jgi:hypothetical protein
VVTRKNPPVKPEDCYFDQAGCRPVDGDPALAVLMSGMAARTAAMGHCPPEVSVAGAQAPEVPSFPARGGVPRATGAGQRLRMGTGTPMSGVRQRCRSPKVPGATGYGRVLPFPAEARVTVVRVALTLGPSPALDTGLGHGERQRRMPVSGFFTPGARGIGGGRRPRPISPDPLRVRRPSPYTSVCSAISRASSTSIPR